ncbi:MAG: Rrf2 family transcriptional regulator [Planctomycetaceae bacterium]|nr:Rrf2 family transcriptional regulator [Planctomycetaceae bacterium]
MRLSRTVAYALQATIQLAQSRAAGPIPCNMLAAEGQMPERFLLQVLRVLVREGILRSTRGVGGGYALRRSPAEISLLEVIEALDGPITATLPSYEGLPQDSRCKLSHALSALAERARRELDSIKLAHLLPSVDGQEA